MSIAIGIDLGTTNTVAAISTGTVKAIQNKEHEYSTKSIVGYFKSQYIIGSKAEGFMAQDPKNAIISVKRLMGRSFTDDEIQKIKDKYLYTIKAPSDGTEDIKVVLGPKEFSPIEISAMILRKIKEDAEARLGDTVEYATITVPAYFTDKQVTATRLAGTIAGFKVQLIMDEPTAAAYAFGVDNVGSEEAKTIVVYDLGGGTFDVSVLTIAGGNFARLNTEGNMWLGGDDFDHKIMDFVIERVKKEYNVKDTGSNLRFMAELKKAAEKAKTELGSMNRTDITVNSILKDADGNIIDVDVELTREQFEGMISGKVNESIDLVKKAMAGASLTIDEIDNIILVGGSSSIPMIQKALIANFGENKVLKNVDPMLCVAYGAAIMANRLGENIKCSNCNTMNEGYQLTCTSCGTELGSKGGAELQSDRPGGITWTTNMNYGIETEGDNFSVIIPKNTPYPMQDYILKTFATSHSNLRRIKIKVYAGENSVASKNAHQFTVWLPLPKGTLENTKVDVGFMVDSNGVVSKVYLFLKDGSGTKPKELFVDRSLGIDGNSERGKIENQLNELKQKMDNNQQQLDPETYTQLDKKYQEIIDALEENSVSDAGRKAGELNESINKVISSDEPKWISNALGLIWWAEKALQKFGGYLEADQSYKIKTLIEELKTAVQEKNENRASIKYDELDKTLDEMESIVLVLMRLLSGANRAAAQGKSDVSDKLTMLISDIEKDLKNNDVESAIKKLDIGIALINELSGNDTDERKIIEGSLVDLKKSSI